LENYLFFPFLFCMVERNKLDIGISYSVVWFFRFLIHSMTSPHRALYEVPIPSSPAQAHSTVQTGPLHDAVTAVMQYFSVSHPSALVGIKDSRLDQAYKTLSLDVADQAVVDRAIFTAAATENSTARLASSLDRTHVSRYYKWLESEEAVVRQLNRYTEEFNSNPAVAKANLRTEFEIKAKAGQLGPFETLAAHYLLYTEERDLAFGAHMMMSILLLTRPDRVINTHNWLVARDMVLAKKEMYGDAINALRLPLHPHKTTTLEALNHAMLNVSADTGNVVGAGSLPVVNGSVDVTPIETFASQVQQQLRELTQQVLLQGQAQHRHAASPLNDGFRRAYQPMHQQQQQQPQQSRGGRGWRGGRGRGRDWPRAAGADHSVDYPSIEELFAEPPASAPSTASQPSRKSPAPKPGGAPRAPPGF
jgi:hypothetical protein